MMIRAFLQQARELEDLQRQFPGTTIRLSGLGIYTPELTAEQWECCYGQAASEPCQDGARKCQERLAGQQG